MSESLEHLQLVFDEYAELTKHSIEEAIDNEFDDVFEGDEQRALLAICEHDKILKNNFFSSNVKPKNNFNANIKVILFGCPQDIGLIDFMSA